MYSVASLPDQVCRNKFDTFLSATRDYEIFCEQAGAAYQAFSLPERTVTFISSFSGCRAALDSYFQISRTQEPAAISGSHLEPSHTMGSSQEHRLQITELQSSDSDSSTSEEEEEVETAAPLPPAAQQTPAAASSGLCFICDVWILNFRNLLCCFKTQQGNILELHNSRC